MADKENNEIELWDEVIIKKSDYGFTGLNGIVVNVRSVNEVEVMLKSGATYYYDTTNIKRTGKSYPELENIFKQLKGDKNDSNNT